MPWSLPVKNSPAAATFKTKNAVAVTTLPNKIPQQEDTLYIVTPDFQRILVGADETDELIYFEGYNNWSLKTKIAA